MQLLAPPPPVPPLPGAAPDAGAATVLPDVTVLFTDLGGSTALYGRLGDREAFALVRRHFAALRAGVRGVGGTVVKTIGDAVMAVFPEPAAAVRTALAALDGADPPLCLKVGVHRGPAIAAALDEGRPDYFGLTVNVAARLRGLAGPGGGLCLTREVREAPGVRGLLAGLPIEAEAARIAGVDGPPLLVFRLGLPAPPSAGGAAAA